MDIGNKVPTPSLCLLALLWKAVAALLTTALCGCSCLASMGGFCCALAVSLSSLWLWDSWRENELTWGLGLRPWCCFINFGSGYSIYSLNPELRG